MQGGTRKGAGRKPVSDKKQMKNIYLTQSEIDAIDLLELDDCKNFSQKCSELIKIGIEVKMKNPIRYSFLGLL